jgi:hypothetical protein
MMLSFGLFDNEWLDKLIILSLSIISWACDLNFEDKPAWQTRLTRNECQGPNKME